MDRRDAPRWQVRLWLLAMDAATGVLVVLGSVFVLAVLAVWAWAAVDGPWFLAWPLRVVVAVGVLAVIGRRFDRWAANRESAHGAPVQAPQMSDLTPRRTDETRP